jgi:hypothetical protein
MVCLIIQGTVLQVQHTSHQSRLYLDLYYGELGPVRLNSSVRLRVQQGTKSQARQYHAVLCQQGVLE